MTTSQQSTAAFDPNFDDTRWTEAWRQIPVLLPAAASHPSGYRIERRLLSEVMVFGRPYRLSAPFDCRALIDAEGRLWMSNTPQEHIMMYNNAAHSWGQVLVGGLGLGLYPQYAVTGAAGQATGFTVIERSPVVRALVEPALPAYLGVPFEVRTGDLAEYLAGPVQARYDTIFLDTWDTLDAAHLPAIHRLRDLALQHLGPGGRLLLWGYRWMVRLFEDDCRRLLAVEPEERPAWLAGWLERSPGAGLLTPVAEHFAGQVVSAGQMDGALAWCREYILTV